MKYKVLCPICGSENWDCTQEEILPHLGEANMMCKCDDCGASWSLSFLISDMGIADIEPI